MDIHELVKPHGGRLIPLLLRGEELEEEKKRAAELSLIRMSSRETSDLIMMGIGAFSPLRGFMGRSDWTGVCEGMCTSDGLFWPIPITLSVSSEEAASLKMGQTVALFDEEENRIMGTIVVHEKYSISKEKECKEVFRTLDPAHPGVAKVMAQGDVNIGGAVKVFNEGGYPERFPGLYIRPEEARALFKEKGWKSIAALQLRNPMHRSHEYLAKIALEVCDGLFIHQLAGKLKEGDIPAEVRVRCIETLVDHYFPPMRVLTGVYPMEMRYAGPREALLHALFRQNYGVTHMIIGRDHAGVGSYYGPFESQEIFRAIAPAALEINILAIDWTFYCYKCEGMASPKTCPHPDEDHLNLSGTMLRKMLTEGATVPEHFSRPEVLDILEEHYASIDKKVNIDLHRYATGVLENEE